MCACNLAVGSNQDFQSTVQGVYCWGGLQLLPIIISVQKREDSAYALDGHPPSLPYSYVSL